jgi:hypothetical protein
MKMRVAVVVLGLVLAAMAGAWAAGLSEDRKSAFGFKGLVEVRELVVTYEPGAPVKIVAPRARLAVGLEGQGIASFHLATGIGPAGR